MKSKVYLFFKGVAMGAADIVPGVSGGTIALITGIYEELIESIKNINLRKITIDFLKILLISYFLVILCWPDVHQNIF